VLRHAELTPLNRVAVAAIQDYSRPVRVLAPSGEELFWRYYLLSESDALSLIEQKWFPAPPPAAQPSPEPTSQAPPAASVAPPQHTIPPAIPLPTEKIEPEQPTEPKKRAPAKTKRTKSRAPAQPTEFSNSIAEYFSKRNIKLDEDLGSSKTELAAIVRVPSAIGEMRYYCKAKTKKTTTDGDLAAAYLEAQGKGLPLLYLAAGTLSKKAQEVLPTLKGAVVAKAQSEEADY
jgi:hypothetical protein